MATEQKRFIVEATGTENGKSVIWLSTEDGRTRITAPTSVLIMSKLAAEGVHVRNIYEKNGHVGRV